MRWWEWAEWVIMVPVIVYFWFLVAKFVFFDLIVFLVEAWRETGRWARRKFPEWSGD